MVEVIDASDLERRTVYECPECSEQFTSEDTDSGSGNRSPCCGKFGSKVGEGLYVEDADIVVMGV